MFETRRDLSPREIPSMFVMNGCDTNLTASRSRKITRNAYPIGAARRRANAVVGRFKLVVARLNMPDALKLTKKLDQCIPCFQESEMSQVEPMVVLKVAVVKLLLSLFVLLFLRVLCYFFEVISFHIPFSLVNGHTHLFSVRSSISMRSSQQCLRGNLEMPAPALYLTNTRNFPLLSADVRANIKV